MKAKIKKRIKGSISIFLVIIMVPMMCFSGLIVDLSRRELAKAEMSSAGDLTMNSALANYDTVMKDVYGLFAMSQNEKQLQDNLYKYYTDTLLANGIITSADEIESNPLLQDIGEVFGGETSNMLSMEVPKEHFKATKMANSSLANPYILKNQIVEYEKYRAPVSSALSIFDGIASLKKIFDQSKVTKAKTAVDEKSEDVNKAGEKLYKALNTYESMISGFDPEFDKFELNRAKSSMDKYDLRNPSYYQSGMYVVLEAYIRKMSVEMPFDAMMSEKNGKYVFSNLTITSDSKINDNTSSLGKLKGSDNATWGANKTATNEKVKKEIYAAYLAMQSEQVQDAYNNIKNVKNIWSLSLGGQKRYADNYIIYMTEVRDLKAFYDLYIQQCDEDDEEKIVIEDGKNKYEVSKMDINKIFYNATLVSSYFAQYKSRYDIEITAADGVLWDMSSSIRADLNWIEQNNVESNLQTAITELGKLEKEIKALNSANGSLKSEIDNYNGLDESDGFSNQMQQDYEYYKDSFDLKQITALKLRLEALQQYFKDIKKYLTDIKFLGVSLKGCTSVNVLVKETKNKTTRNGVSIQNYINNQINANKSVNDVRDYLINEYSEGIPPTKIEISVKDEEFYKYLQKAYSVKDDSEKGKEQKDLKNELKKNAGSATDSTNGSGDAVSVTLSDEIKATLPSQGSYVPGSDIEGYNGKDDKFSSLFDRITKAMSDMISGLSNAAKAGRDNLYVSIYATDMFTYATMEAEYKKENEDAVAEAVKKTGKSKDASLSELGLALETSSGIKKNKENNYMYGAEIEYMLYGGFDTAANVKKAKTNIFYIRFLANSGYALTSSDIKSVTLPPAIAIQSATYGIVPYKLTQVVFQLCLALAESANDMQMMSRGEKVALIKTRNTWVMSPQGALNKVKDLTKDAATDLVKSTANEVKGVINDLVDKGAEKADVAVDDYIHDMTVTINDQVDQIIGDVFVAFEIEVIDSLDKALKSGQNVANNAVAISESVISSADSKAQAMIDKCSPSVKPIVESLYKTYVKDKIDTYKQEIVSAVSQFNELNAGQVLLNAQEKISGSIKDAVENAAAKISEKTEGLITELKTKIQAKSGEVIDMGADKLLDITNDYLDSTFDSISKNLPSVGDKKTNSSVLSSVLEFNYGDYLKIFLFLKLCTDNETVMSRMADVMQLNVNYGLKDSGYKHPNQGKFTMGDAYTYIQVEADVHLKTMFMSLHMVTDFSGESGNYFNLKYNSVLGY